MSKKCIVDSSSAILLYKAGIFNKLLKYYEVLCPPIVISELTRIKNYPGADFFSETVQNNLVTIVEPALKTRESLEMLNKTMGPGEAECIVLYLDDAGDFIIIDDRKGAAWCRQKSIPYINALLVPVIFRQAGILTEEKYKCFFDSLLQTGRYSRKIIHFARSAKPEMLAPFLPVKN